MDPTRFDRLTIAVGQPTTRRAALGLLAALGLTGLGRGEALAICAGNGTPCTGGTTCCSGLCKRKRGTTKFFCRQAPGQGICTTGQDQCGAGSINCNAANAGPCVCHVTTQGSSVCGKIGLTCFDCETNTDCVKRPGVGRRGDRCVQCNATNCPTTNGRACVRKCPKPAGA